MKISERSTYETPGLNNIRFLKYKKYLSITGHILVSTCHSEYYNLYDSSIQSSWWFQKVTKRVYWISFINNIINTTLQYDRLCKNKIQMKC